MAVTQTHINNQLIKWRKRIYREWRRGNYFSPYMGESPTAIIQVTNELKAVSYTHLTLPTILLV